MTRRWIDVAVVAGCALAVVVAALIFHPKAHAEAAGVFAAFDKVTCTNSATQLPTHSAVSVMFKVPQAATVSVYVGDANVTNSTSYADWPAGSSPTYNIYNTNQLYCFASSSQVVPFEYEVR